MGRVCCSGQVTVARGLLPGAYRISASSSAHRDKGTPPDVRMSMVTDSTGMSGMESKRADAYFGRVFRTEKVKT